MPIEVKSSAKGHMKSLQLFLDSHPHAQYGLKIAMGEFARHDDLVEIPLYAIEGWLKSE